MKKFIVSLLVLSLALSPVFSLGQRELGLKTIFLREDSKEVTKSLTEKSTTLSNQVAKSEINSTELKNLDEKSVEEMEDSEIVNEIVTTAIEGSAINQATLRSLAIIQTENNRMKEEIEENNEYIATIETSLEEVKAESQEKEVAIAEKDGQIDTLSEKLKARKSYKSLLVGAGYNLVTGYSVGVDFGVKFAGGLTTQVGVSLPIDDINPIGALNVNNYSVTTKIGWSW